MYTVRLHITVTSHQLSHDEMSAPHSLSQPIIHHHYHFYESFSAGMPYFIYSIHITARNL